MRLILLSIFIYVQSVSADLIKQEWLGAKHQDVIINQQNGIKYPMVHMERSNAQPVIFLHGFSASVHSWMDLAPEIYKAGFDVWCFGWNTNDHRNVQETGEHTVEEMVEYVYKKTKKRPFIVGHSLGGVFAKIYSFGIQINNTTKLPFINPLRQLKSKRRLKGVISITSPNGKGFNDLFKFHPLYKLYDRLPYKYTSRDLSKLINGNRLAFEETIVRTIEYNTLALRLPVIKKATLMLLNPAYQPISEHNFGKIVRYAVGRIPKSMHQEVLNYKRFPYTFLFHSATKFIPMAYVAAEADILAENDTIYDEAGKSPYLELPRAGHLDPLFGDQVVPSAKFIIKFLNKNN